MLNQHSNSHSRYFSSSNTKSNKQTARTNQPNTNSTSLDESVSGNPILRNVFMRPQVISLNQTTTGSMNSMIHQTRQNNNSGMSTSSSSSSSSSTALPIQANSSASSSLSSTPSCNEATEMNPRSILRKSGGGPKQDQSSSSKKISNQIESLLDSKKAREAFFERIRSETLKVHKKKTTPKCSNCIKLLSFNCVTYKIRL